MWANLNPEADYVENELGANTVVILMLWKLKLTTGVSEGKIKGS